MTTDGVDVIGGVDTHGHTQHTAAISEVNGKLLGDKEFPATAAGYRHRVAEAAKRPGRGNPAAADHPGERDEGRTAAINQMRSVLVGAPDELRASIAGLNRGALVSHCARLRVDVSRIGEPAITANIVLRQLARRVQTLDGEIAETDEQMADLVADTAPATSAISGVGNPSHRSAADDPPGTTRTASAARPRWPGSAVPRPSRPAPVPPPRYRLHRGGDRQANSAIYLVVVNRLRWHLGYPDLRSAPHRGGKDQKEIMRCLKRAVVRDDLQPRSGQIWHRKTRTQSEPRINRLLLDNA